MKSTKKYKITKSSDFAIKLVGVSKKYTIHHEKPTLMEVLVKGKTEEFWALKSINLEVKEGEKIGIIGHNGSGKTTLLKIISGITTPTYGQVKVKGRIVSLIDLEAGFHPELTGIQNIYLNGAILGMTKSKINSVLLGITRFAGIGKFMDAPLFTYSEGMKLRLGFSIAIYADPDILILDESLGVGDINFVNKTQKKINELFKKGKTILIVTQWIDYLRKNCNRFILVNKGRITKDGSVSVLDKYQKKNIN